MEYQKKLNNIIQGVFKGKDDSICDSNNPQSKTADKKKIIIIDDDVLSHEMYAMKFQKSGFDVKAVSTGNEALDILRNGFNPDIILLDLMIPVMDGFSIYDLIKKENLAPGAVAIMLTNKGVVSEINKAKECGFQGYIVKAITTPAEVVDKVNKICIDYCKK